jgi:competence protein ComGC
MTTRCLTDAHGLTFIEALVVLAILCVLLALILPHLAIVHPRPRGSRCFLNLKQTSLGALLWAQDGDQQFPWERPLSRTGTLELASSPQVFRHFAVMSNELVSPNILICPLDNGREAGREFSVLSNQNLSYFVNLASHFRTNLPAEEPLFGDRNLTGGVLSNGTVRILSSTNGLGWSQDLHQHFGNIALADGSVSSVSTQALHEMVQTSVSPPRLAVP